MRPRCRESAPQCQCLLGKDVRELLGPEQLAPLQEPHTARVARKLDRGRVAVGGARLRIEQSGRRNNLRTILGSVDRAHEDGTDQAGVRQLVIEQLDIGNVTAAFYLDDLEQEWSLTVPEITLAEGSRRYRGAAPGTVARLVLAPLIRAALACIASPESSTASCPEGDRAAP